jgi:hypothetical protein
VFIVQSRKKSFENSFTVDHTLYERPHGPSNLIGWRLFCVTFVFEKISLLLKPNLTPQSKFFERNNHLLAISQQTLCLNKENFIRILYTNSNIC